MAGTPQTPGAGTGSAALKGGSGDAAPTKTPRDYRDYSGWWGVAGTTTQAEVTLYSQIT